MDRHHEELVEVITQLDLAGQLLLRSERRCRMPASARLKLESAWKCLFEALDVLVKERTALQAAALGLSVEEYLAQCVFNVRRCLDVPVGGVFATPPVDWYPHRTSHVQILDDPEVENCECRDGESAASKPLASDEPAVDEEPDRKSQEMEFFFGKPKIQ